MALTVEAIYENGVLKPVQPLPLGDHEKVQITVHTSSASEAGATAVRRGYGLISWTGSLEDLDYLIEDAENDPLQSA